MQEYIYALHLKDQNSYFYIGRSNNLLRRMGEHKNNAAAGHTETKYQVIREIVAAGEEWSYTVLAEVTEEDEDFEDYYVYKALCEGHPLANMKAGDARAQAQEAAMGTMRGRGERYGDPKTFLDAREREVKEAAARAATARLNAKTKRLDASDPARTLFSFEKPEEKFISPWMQARKARGHVHKGPPPTITEQDRIDGKAAEWRDICQQEESRSF